MQAVIKIGSSQYLVSPKSQILADRDQIDQVLLVIDGEHVQIGQPEVAQAKIKLTNLGPVKGDKIRVSKFKAKSRYHKVIGFRPQYFRLQIEDIALREKK